MNSRTLHQTLVLSAAALLAQTQLSAQPWQTVDDFQYTPGKMAYAMGMGADALGNVYAAGKGTNGHWLVRKGANHGSSWSTVDDFQYGSAATAAACGADGSGNVYVCGSGTDPATGSHWLVRRATP
jgi:hypothetical protein